MDSWIGLKQNCGNCTALIFTYNYRTCNDFCTAQGLECEEAREDRNNDCEDDGQYHYTCEYDWHVHETSDAICKCSSSPQGT